MATSKAQAGNNVVVTATVEVIGVALLALLAGANDQLGSIIVLVMVGFLIGWALINTAKLQKWVAKA
jgi:uncharacterized membrane protein